jgi:glucose-6-phosphate 1-dehydrogenase
MTDQAIVIFGATGDLALRMLYPSLYFLDQDGLLAKGLRILGCSRTELENEAFVARIREAVALRAEGGKLDDRAWTRFAARLAYVAGDAGSPDVYATLCTRLQSVDDCVYYLSTSPALYDPIIKNLAAAGLNRGRARVVVEKPLGRDLASCRAINDTLAHAFSEDRIFRIDHYLGKEAVQNLLALRFANTFFEPLWNKLSIDHVQITVAETVGVEGRWGYYDDYGALRDMVQNHLLQLVCLVAMEPPASLDADSVRNEKVKVLRSLRRITGRDVERRTVRGQYRRGVAEGREVPGYPDEAGGKDSRTETYVALCAHVDNWRWAGVPFYLRTGKRLPTRSSQIVIQFREVPHSIFPGQNLLANRLTIRLQPEEDISLMLMNKTPDLDEGGMKLKPLDLSLKLGEAFKDSGPRRRIAYERLLLEALHDNPTLFVRRDEAEAAWSWIDGVLDGWERSGLAPTPYVAGTWGPAGAFALIERDGHSWYE